MPNGYELKDEKNEEKYLQEHLLKTYKEKMHNQMPEGFAETLEELPWESILELTEDYKDRMKERTSEIKHVQRKLSFSLIIIKEHLKNHKAGKVGFDIKFVKSLLNLMNKAYKLSIQYEVDLDEFMLLLTIIIEKMKKEKLNTYTKKRIVTKNPRSFQNIDTKIDYEDDKDDEEK